MDPSTLTEGSFFDHLLDPRLRARLQAAMRGPDGPVQQQYCDLASVVEDAEKLSAAVHALLSGPERYDGDLLDPLLGNPVTPHEALWAAYRQGRGMDALGHRRGPRNLLEALAEEHRYSEAITTLALYHYAAEDDAFFRAFVERHGGDPMLRYNLEHSPVVSPQRRAAIADLLAG